MELPDDQVRQTMRTDGPQGCCAPRAARPLGQPDPEAVADLELLGSGTAGFQDRWALGAARLLGQPDLGLLGTQGCWALGAAGSPNQLDSQGLTGT